MRKAIDTMDLFTAALGLVGTLVSVGVPLMAVARRRARAEAEDAAAGESDGAPRMAEPPPEPYVPPDPMPPPPQRPPPPKPDQAKELLNKGGKFIAAVLLATPLAPLTPFIGPIVVLLGIFADEHAKGAVAQPRLRETFATALDDAEYQGYMEEYAAGQAAWEQGLELQAREHFERAEAAGKAKRLEAAQYIDDLNRDSYHAWMAKPHALTSDADWAMQGYTYGDGGYTLFPSGPIDGDRSAVTGPRYQDNKNYRYHWRPGHPDYNGTEIPPLNEQQRAAADAKQEAEEERATQVEVTGEDEITDAKFQNHSIRKPDPKPRPPAPPSNPPAAQQPPAELPPPAPQPSPAPVVPPASLPPVLPAVSKILGVNLPPPPVPAPVAIVIQPAPARPTPPVPPGAKKKLALSGEDGF